MKNIKDTSFVAEELAFAKELKLEASTSQTSKVETNVKEQVNQKLELTGFKPTLYHGIMVSEVDGSDGKFRIYSVQNSYPNNWTEDKLQITQKGNILTSLSESEFRLFQQGKLNVSLLKKGTGENFYFLTK